MSIGIKRNFFSRFKFSVVNVELINDLTNRVSALELEIDQAIRFMEQFGSVDNPMFLAKVDKTPLTKSLISLHSRISEIITRNDETTWIAKGLAQLAQALAGQSDIEGLSQTALRNVLRYVKAHRGALFVLNDENSSDHFLELKGLYASERQEHIGKRVDITEGLVGQCFQKSELISVTNAPTSYLKISSGLGSVAPASIALAPLKHHDQKIGVLELAFLKPVISNQMEFLTKAAENAAAAIANIKTTRHIQKLLAESQEITNQLIIKERELERRNVEIERIKQLDMELIENKLGMQRMIYEKTISKLREKIAEFQRENNRALIEVSQQA